MLVKCVDVTQQLRLLMYVPYNPAGLLSKSSCLFARVHGDMKRFQQKPAVHLPMEGSVLNLTYSRQTTIMKKCVASLRLPCVSSLILVICLGVVTSFLANITGVYVTARYVYGHEYTESAHPTRNVQ